MAKLEKKEIYTVEDLVNHKLRASEREAKLLKSLVKIQFEAIGEMDKDYDWAKSHHKDDLPWYNLFSITEEKEEEFRKVLRKIFKKQLGNAYLSEHNADWYCLMYGFPTYTSRFMDGDNWDGLLKRKIKEYEEKNGELKYDDGFEVVLKKRVGYGE